MKSEQEQLKEDYANLWGSSSGEDDLDEYLVNKEQEYYQSQADFMSSFEEDDLDDYLTSQEQEYYKNKEYSMSQEQLTVNKEQEQDVRSQEQLTDTKDQEQEVRNQEQPTDNRLQWGKRRDDVQATGLELIDVWHGKRIVFL